MTELNLEALKQTIGTSDVSHDTVQESRYAQFQGTLAPFLASSSICPVPPGFHWTMFQPETPYDELRNDGHPVRLSLIPELPFASRMWAGGSVTFLDTLNIGDPLTRTSTVRSIDLKEGSSGALLFIEIGHEYQRGDKTVISETQSIVYRNPTKPVAFTPLAPETPEPGTLNADSRLLFRYSALTFNTHRIHYDRNYAISEEGYPGLVVHGPLQATLLMNLIASKLGHSGFTFFYRGTAPLFAGQNARLQIKTGNENTAHIERGPDDITMKGRFQLNES